MMFIIGEMGIIICRTGIMICGAGIITGGAGIMTSRQVSTSASCPSLPPDQ